MSAEINQGLLGKIKAAAERMSMSPIDLINMFEDVQLEHMAKNEELSRDELNTALTNILAHLAAEAETATDFEDETVGDGLN